MLFKNYIYTYTRTSHTYTDIHACIQTYRHTYIHTDRHTDIRTCRHTDIKTCRQTDRLTYIHTCTYLRYIYIYIHTQYIHIVIYYRTALEIGHFLSCAEVPGPTDLPVTWRCGSFDARLAARELSGREKRKRAMPSKAERWGLNQQYIYIYMYIYSIDHLVIWPSHGKFPHKWMSLWENHLNMCHFPWLC